MPTFKLISSASCPFVQRSVITLAHKGVPFEATFVDLADKPGWFLELSPLGKVPVLVVCEGERESVLFESAVINEYLDEITEGSLLPTDPLLRAQHRMMIEFSSAALGDCWRMSTAPTREEAREHARRLRAKLERLEAEIVGPMFCGDELCLVDTACIPMLQRTIWTEEAAPELVVFGDGELPRVRAWYAAALQFSAVGDSSAKMRWRYRAFLSKRSDSWVGAKLSAG